LLASLDFPPEPEVAVKPRFIPWRKLVHNYATAWNWPFNWVGELTLYHVKLYPADENNLGGIANVQPGEHEIFAQMRRERKQEMYERARHSFRESLRRNNPDQS
jgi:hypothetical protein